MKKPKQIRPIDESFEKIQVYLPKKTLEILKSISKEKDTPVSRLCAIAVDNELDVSPSFNYPCDMPTTPFISQEYINSAGKLFKFLQQSPHGNSIDSLMLCRRDMGIESRKELMYAYRELLQTELIETFTPKFTMFKYGKDYKRIRIKK